VAKKVVLQDGDLEASERERFRLWVIEDDRRFNASNDKVATDSSDRAADVVVEKSTLLIKSDDDHHGDVVVNNNREEDDANEEERGCRKKAKHFHPDRNDDMTQDDALLPPPPPSLPLPWFQQHHHAHHQAPPPRMPFVVAPPPGGAGHHPPQAPFVFFPPSMMWHHGPTAVVANTNRRAQEVLVHHVVRSLSSSSCEFVRSFVRACAVVEYRREQVACLRERGSPAQEAAQAMSHISRCVPNEAVRHGRWSNDEHQLFLRLMGQFGRSWTKISRAMGGRRSEPQVRSHAQKYFQRLRRAKEIEALADQIARESRREAKKRILDNSHGQSDVEDSDDDVEDPPSISSGGSAGTTRHAATRPPSSSSSSSHQLRLLEGKNVARRTDDGHSSEGWPSGPAAVGARLVEEPSVPTHTAGIIRGPTTYEAGSPIAHLLKVIDLA